MALSNKQISPKERQANVDALIYRLINSKKEIIAEMQEDFKKPQFQEALKKLREKNAKQQATIGV
jgi:hypothetical protein